MAHSIGNHGSFPHPRPLSHGGGRGEHPWRGSPLASHAGEGVGGEGTLAVVNL